jgi:alkylation response protein AidB-like acyl-CoA dehydrogenase
MRADLPRFDLSQSAEQLGASFRFDEVVRLRESYAVLDEGTIVAILEQAAAFATDTLEPLNRAMDVQGVELRGGRVHTAPGHREAWAAFVANGWPSIDQEADYGGQQLPLPLCLAVQEIFDRACPAFGMLPVPQRSAARLIAAFATQDVKHALLPALASGELGATICISEAGAGSDVLQMRTRAREAPDGGWRISGEKCWISFGDHDLTDAIVHCVLARSDDGSAARPEISLFLVDTRVAGADGVQVLRIEEKLGLHGSPTCTLAFEDAPATLIGERGRGLAQMFVMITQMRLAVSAMGLGIACAASDVALAYARERRQGGKPGDPQPIVTHADVRRQLLELTARTELLRGLMLNIANLAELAAHGEDAADRERCAALVQWFLPIAKTFGADCAFANASGAIQVLGGAGYTAEWPVEQALRDARVLSVFEGTSGIQAIDLLQRRVIRDGAGLQAFLAQARADGGETPLARCLDLLEGAASTLKAASPADQDAGAAAFLDLAMLAGAGWIAARFVTQAGDHEASARMRAAGRYWLDRIEGRAAMHHAEAVQGAGPIAHFGAFA